MPISSSGSAGTIKSPNTTPTSVFSVGRDDAAVTSDTVMTVQYINICVCVCVCVYVCVFMCLFVIYV